MRKVLLITLVSIFSLTALANDNGEKKGKLKSFSISGKVTDNNEGLTGVNVIIDGKKTKVYTDFDGNFTLDNVLEGNHTISFNMIAYESKTIQINTNELRNIVVEMSDR